MANFKLSIPHILASEGGFAETEAGEYVNRGVNIETLLAIGYKESKDYLKKIIKNLTQEETEEIYYQFYWTFKKPSVANALEQLHSQTAATKILDMTVLSGQITAIMLVQKALGVKVDGFFGPNTLIAAQTLGDALTPKLVEVWTESLTNIADYKIANAKSKGNASLVKYWTQVKVGWLARASGHTQ